jgi:hypothetical protein
MKAVPDVWPYQEDAPETIAPVRLARTANCGRPARFHRRMESRRVGAMVRVLHLTFRTMRIEARSLDLRTNETLQNRQLFVTQNAENVLLPSIRFR